MPRISIHAPREGGDDFWLTLLRPSRAISIHAPREGGDPRHLGQAAGTVKYFNPRPPARGATNKKQMEELRNIFQSTPPARGATNDLETAFAALKISIHAPREGGDKKTLLVGRI